jgi:hypothetical protein
MACQSLDNDEILNVRWATEDPNPVQKVAEKERLEEIGQEAIRARMDPRVVDAMRAVRALEDGDVLDDTQANEVDEVVGDEQNDGPPDMKRRRLVVEAPDEHERSTGLLSADTLEGLKYFAEIRRRNGLALSKAKKAPPPKPPAGLGLGDYGSDEDD